jgi:plasmid maintenance system killer protein
MKAKKIINSEAINIVFTSSPPHSLQLIGLRLKKYLKIKWVADFRDPWVDAFWEAGEKRTFYSQNVIDNQERKVFLNADKVITVSPTLQKRFEYKFSRKIEFIANGYDEDDIAKIEIKKSEKIVLRYFGSIALSIPKISLILF